VTGAEHTLVQFIARFTLRRQATSAEFMAGLWLVSAGAVQLRHFSARMLQALVRDGTVQAVSITAHGDTFIGECSCGSARDEVCRHQVAATHVAWLQLPKIEIDPADP
jgi:uncharacterized Zn finger protein